MRTGRTWPSSEAPAASKRGPLLEAYGFCDSIFSKIFFAPGRASLDPRQRGGLDQNLRELRDTRCRKAMPSLELVGHAGKAEKNRTKLVTARLQAIKKYLVGKGYDAERILLRSSQEPTPNDPDFSFDPETPLQRTRRYHPPYGRVDFVVLAPSDEKLPTRARVEPASPPAAPR